MSKDKAKRTDKKEVAFFSIAIPCQVTQFSLIIAFKFFSTHAKVTMMGQ